MGISSTGVKNSIMYFDDQHRALRKIFDYVRSQGRIDLLNAYRNAAKIEVITKKEKPKKKRQCSECYHFISPGEEYYREDSKHNSSSGPYFVTKQTCVNCFEEKEKIEEKEKVLLKMKFISDD